MNIDLKSALIGAVAVIFIMALATLPYAIVNANERQEQGQKDMIANHKADIYLNRERGQ